MSSPEKFEKKMERSEVDSMLCKGNEVILVNPQFLMCSSLSWIEDGNIPEWLLVELLIRLPAKFVFRFKLVSKQWLSIISDPCFVRAYITRASLLSQQPWPIVALNMHHKGSQNKQVLDYGLLEDLYLKPSLCVVAVPSIHQSQAENYLIFAVSSGLLLYGLNRVSGEECIVKRSYYICNPLTGHCVALPPLMCKLTTRGWGFLTHVKDGLLTSYRVVRVDVIGESNNIRFQVYVSETGEWKDFIMPSNLQSPVRYQRAATALNGVLHWVVAKLGIIAYDPYENPKCMRVIAFPGDTENLEMQDESNCLCVAHQGKLRYLEVGGLMISGNAFPSFRVWVLNDYNSGDWCLQHNISYTDVQYDANFPSQRWTIGPICFHPFDSDIVYLGCDNVCVSYNIKTTKLQVEEEFFRHAGNVSKVRRVCWRWTRSFLFVVPHWPISIPMEG